MRIVLLISLVLLCTVSARNLFEIDAGWQLAGHSQKAARDVASCEVATCANKGDMCNGTNTVCVEDKTFCNFTLNTCQEPVLLKYGEPCNRDSQCEGSCINNFCNALGRPGTSCSSNYQCAYRVGVDPYIALCKDKRCAGMPEGGQCDSSSDCFPPLSCNFDTDTCVQPGGEGTACSNDNNCKQTLFCDSQTEKCKAYLNKGDTCELGEEECGDSSCTPTATTLAAGTCKEYFSQALNAPCDNDEQCMLNLYCNDTLHTCQNGFSLKDSSRKLCNETSDCAYFEECDCDGKGENRCFASPSYFGITSEYKKKWEKIRSCESGCLRTDYNCLAKCGDQQCSMYSYLFGMQADVSIDRGYPKCYAEHEEKIKLSIVGLPGFYTCDGSTVFASLILVVASVFLLLI